MTIKIKIELCSDLEKILLDKINTLIIKSNINVNSEHYKQIQNYDFEKLLDVYLNLLDRLLICRKASVFLSKDIKCNPKYQKYKNEIVKLKKLLENGSSIRPFLSDRINNLIYKKSEDKLLLDWGLHHIHFYPITKRKNKNDNNILFVLKQDNNIYFIDIFTHNDFYNYKALDIVHRNWKDVLNLYKLTGIKPDTLIGEKIKDLRKLNVAYTIGFSDEPDIAYGTNNRSLDRQKMIEAISRKIKKLQIDIENSTDNIVEEIYNQTNKKLFSLNIKLVIKHNKLSFFETNSNTTILINNENEIENMLKYLLIIE